MSFFTLKNGLKLYYEDQGSGQPVILMHGWTSSHAVYSKPVQRLCRKARCIIYDHRGHGGSKEANREKVTMETLASDLNELITGLSLSNVTLVGWSMGAGVAMNYIRDYGCSALKQVVLCDMSPKQLNDAEWKLGLYRGEYTKVEMKRDEKKNFSHLYQSFAIGAMPRLKRVPDVLLQKILKKQLKNCDETVLKSLSASMKIQDNREVIGKITVPITYFYATPGSLFSPELADWYRRNTNMPVRTVAFKKSTHMFIMEHPEQFAKELEKLL
ncbi:MAG: alpha/beta hydrolase [Lachnospiraceae bacterium]|nr:alpha/beta hydrolase [Lachnospiraceae bacterium]